MSVISCPAPHVDAFRHAVVHRPFVFRNQEEALLSYTTAVPGLCAELAPHVYAILDSFMERTRCTARRASVMRSWSLAAELEYGFAVAGAAFVRRHDVFALIPSADLRLFMQDRV